jgi:hypothetical protein
VRPMPVVCVSEPDVPTDVPVMVTVAGPVAAVLLAARVRVLVPVVLAGLNNAVTPLGKPVAARLTLPVKPLAGFTVIVLGMLFPCTTLSVLGAADSVKLGGSVTVRLMVVVCVSEPDVPVMVTVAAPVVAVLLAVSVSVLVPVVLAGLNDAVTPLGKPLAARLTLPVKPPVGFTVIVLGTLLPCTTPRVLGEADSVKLGGSVTVRLTVVVCVSEPDVPVMVTVAPPVVAELLAVKVRVLVPVVLAGLNNAVTPLGKPVAARLTLPVKPPAGFTVIVLGMLLP